MIQALICKVSRKSQTIICSTENSLEARTWKHINKTTLSTKRGLNGLVNRQVVGLGCTSFVFFSSNTVVDSLNRERNSKQRVEERKKKSSGNSSPCWSRRDKKRVGELQKRINGICVS